VPIVSVQNRYSFADREWDYVVDYCERDGIVFLPWFPLASGKVANTLLERIAKNNKKAPKAGWLSVAVEAVAGHAAYSWDLID
jgi:pyridoxine 4-dehydrogenase